MEKLNDDLFLARAMFLDALHLVNFENVHSRKTFQEYIARFLFKNDLANEKNAEIFSNEFIEFFEKAEIEFRKFEVQAEIAVPEYNNHAGYAPAIIY